MAHSQSLVACLYQPRIRALWSANLLSNFGSWGQIFALTWQVSTLSHSASKTAMVQTALWLPMLVLAIPAGLLGDLWHRPKLLFWSNASSCLIACILCLISFFDLACSNILLILCLLSGCANAFTLPSWQSSIAALVKKSQLSAIAGLNNLSYNLAACIAPFIAAGVVTQLGVSALYLFNACSFVSLLTIYQRWYSQEQSTPRPYLSLKDLWLKSIETFALPLTVRGNRDFPLLLMTSFGIFCMCSAWPALLPSLCLIGANSSISNYGNQMAAFGGGAVFAAAILPLARRHASEKLILLCCSLGYSLMLFAVSVLNHSSLTITIIVIGGISWSGIVTNINSTALRILAVELRTRGLALLVVATAGAQAIGGIVWGLLSENLGVAMALTIAASMLINFSLLVFYTQSMLEPE